MGASAYHGPSQRSSIKISFQAKLVFRAFRNLREHFLNFYFKYCLIKFSHCFIVKSSFISSSAILGEIVKYTCPCAASVIICSRERMEATSILHWLVECFPNLSLKTYDHKRPTQLLPFDQSMVLYNRPLWHLP